VSTENVITILNEVASAALSAEQRKAIWTKEAHDLQAIADQEANAQAKAAEQSAQQWKSAADTIAGAMNSQVDGLLRGTETMRQAFAKMAESMIEDAIKWTIKAIAEQGAVVAAHVTGATAIAAADQSAGAAGALSWIGSALHAVEAAAAQTFAGVSNPAWFLLKNSSICASVTFTFFPTARSMMIWVRNAD